MPLVRFWARIFAIFLVKNRRSNVTRSDPVPSSFSFLFFVFF